MIHIFFDPGSFGSTVEFVIHNYTNHSHKVSGYIRSDGSLHSYHKQHHVCNAMSLQDFVGKNKTDNTVTTPIYPFDSLKLPEIIQHFEQLPSWHQDTKILIYQPTIRAVELNLLFKYHKVVTGSLNMGLGVLVGDNAHNLSGWNVNYTHWNQMKPWELREWFSIFYADYHDQLTNAKEHVDLDQWLVVTNLELVNNPAHTWIKIADYCGLTMSSDMENFARIWQQAQQYVIDEFELLDKIIQNSLSDTAFDWQPVNIVAEAIVQQRLRAIGYEIKCDGLDIFPTDAKILHSLLDKVIQ